MALAAPIRAGSSQLLWNPHLRKTRSQVLCLPLFQNKRLNPPLESTDTEKRDGGYVPQLKPDVRLPNWPAFRPPSDLSSGLACPPKPWRRRVPHHCSYPLRALRVSAFSAISPSSRRSGSYHPSLVPHHSSLITALVPSSLFPCTYKLPRVPARSMSFIFCQLQTPVGGGWSGGWMLEAGSWTGETRPSRGLKIPPKPDQKRPIWPHFLTNFGPLDARPKMSAPLVHISHARLKSTGEPQLRSSHRRPMCSNSLIPWSLKSFAYWPVWPRPCSLNRGPMWRRDWSARMEAGRHNTPAAAPAA